MATMVKEKRKEKKKTKEKYTREPSPVTIQPVTLEGLSNLDEQECSVTPKQVLEEATTIENEPTESNTTEPIENVNITANTSKIHNKSIESANLTEHASKTHENPIETLLEERTLVAHESNTLELTTATQIREELETPNMVELINQLNSEPSSKTPLEGSYKELSNKLERMAIPNNTNNTITEQRELELAHPNAYLLHNESQSSFEAVSPSAPCFAEIPETVEYQEEIAIETKPRMKSITIEEVINLIGRKEIEEVKALSEREEELVEAGPVCGPEHPLVDLLLTFRSSLIAVERERIQLACGFANEEKSRNTLWKIEKCTTNITEKCACGSSVQFSAMYEKAELQKERLPVAKLKLEGLLRDVQDSYCHHQHAALLAHCQIEELISNTIQSNKNIIREALALILQALRVSDTAPVALASALERWATALAAALLDERDIRQLLFVMHQLFRQSRSVQWASRVVHVSVDVASPPRVLALLELVLARPRLETALECTEESDETWEEVDKHGVSSAVSEGTLRERDLLSLFHAFPLRDLVARLVLFTHSDIRKARPHEWGDSTGGHGVLRACYGTRYLLHVLQRATNTHTSYARLKQALRDLATQALHALANLHLVSKSFYAPELSEKISAELEAAFSSGFTLMDGQELYKLPATLLAEHTASDYCVSFIVALHDKCSKHMDLLSVEMPVLACDVRVRIVTQAGVEREDHTELARMVLDFLLQTGIKRKSLSCKDGCEATSRECVSRLLSAHRYLHTIALHSVAELNMVESLDPSSVIQTLQVDSWRPQRGEAIAVLDDWARRCPLLLSQLLSHLDYTPYTGIALDVQLSIGSWLCNWVSRSPSPPEWAWLVLRMLRVHRTTWRLVADAPSPETEPTDLFSMAYALLASSWGHSIPEICSEGVGGLVRLAGARVREAVHCLSPVMLVMTQSPESVTLTPKFSEVLTILLSSGPSLMQRALGRGAATGAELVLRLVLAQLDAEYDGDISRANVLKVWLHALWRAGAASGAGAIADAAACHTRLWPHLDEYAAALLMEENSKEHINHAVRAANTAPLLCECVLRACHSHREARSHVYARLLAALCQQRANKQKIHVDNALQQIGASISSEELAVYRCAGAALSAPPHHPAHLTLWRLLLHVYLQRHPDHMLESTPPIGPLFFSGLLKSRTLAQMKRRLQDTILYHHNEIDKLKSNSSETKEQSSKNVEKQQSISLDDGLLPMISIRDLTGDSSDSSDSDSESEVSREDERDSTSVEARDAKKNVMSMIAYHTAAERLLNEYLSWLEEGENVKALPHHADIARFIPEHALEAAWRAVPRPPPSPDLDSFPLPTPPSPPARSPPTAFHRTVKIILGIKDRSKRYKKPTIKSPVADIDLNDARNLLAIVDHHLKDIEKLAEEWCTEVRRLSSLDSRLWELVCALRVRRPLPPMRKQCPQKCKPITLTTQEHEWCISLDAQRGVADNRSGARAALRRLARPRPHAVKSAAVLHAIARHTRSSVAGVRVVERAWRCAGARSCGDCAPAQAVLLALVQQLAERWICHDGRTVSSLLSCWGGRACSALQQSLCGALLAPRRLPPPDWPAVYTQLLSTKLPSHTIFSYLSKFELARWSEAADPSQRRDLLEALLKTVQKWGAAPPTEHHMLIEILGVHSAVLLDGGELCAHVVRCARAAVGGTLPPAHWTHVIRAVETKAGGVSFDQLGHLLRELGVIWWEVRTGAKTRKGWDQCCAHAPYVAKLLHTLQRCFVAAAVALSYAPERVAWLSWSSLREAWGPWVCPLPAAPPLLPSTADDEQYTPMLRHFVDSVHQIMIDCPGTEIHLLQQIFEWCVQTYVTIQSVPSGSAAVISAQESRVQASALLVELSKLPWSEHEWFYGKCLQIALQVSTCADRELTSWCCSTWNNTTQDTLLHSAISGQEELAPLLASLLYLFTGTTLPHSHQILEQACQLPWHRLPDLALDEALERFFMVHHNPAVPYHDLLQFRIILVASGLLPAPGLYPTALVCRSGEARARCTSQWVRGACAPALHAHVHAHTHRLLQTVTQLLPYLEHSEDELEELLSRAIIIMCMEPAATVALPVWVSWVSSAPPRLVLAAVGAVGTLTAFEYFATLADAAVQSLLNCSEAYGWCDVSGRWARCPWRAGGPLAQRARPHAAYACARAHTHDWAGLRDTLAGLLTASVDDQLDFVESEPMLGVWVCAACRWAQEAEGGGGGAGARECGAAARALLARWAEPPRRSLLQLVVKCPDYHRPTPLHRILCCYAQCVLSPTEDNRRAYDSACTAALGATNDVSSWGHAPRLHKLVRLAMRLFPKHHRYFQHELCLAPETD